MFSCRLNEFKKMAWRSDLGDCERFDREITTDYQDRKGVEIIREKARMILNSTDAMRKRHALLT